MSYPAAIINSHFDLVHTNNECTLFKSNSSAVVTIDHEGQQHVVDQFAVYHDDIGVQAFGKTFKGGVYASDQTLHVAS